MILRNVSTATDLMQGGLINIGPIVSVDASVSGAKMERITHARNMVKFETLETSIPVPDMSVPEDEISTSSGGISNTGWNAFASQETDGTRMGLGWGHAWENTSAFGDEVRLVAGSGDDILDVTWASMNEARFAQVWKGASLNSVATKTVAEVNRAIDDAGELAERVREMLGGEKASVPIEATETITQEIAKPDLVEEYKATNPIVLEKDVAVVKNVQKIIDNSDAIVAEIAHDNAAPEEPKAESIVTQLFGVPLAEASGGVAVEASTMDAVTTALQYMAAKYGVKVAKFVAMKVIPRAVPGVGQALLAKDVYDLINDYVFTDDDVRDDVLEKRQHGKDKARKMPAEGAISAGGMPDPDDFEPEDKDDHKETKFKWEVKNKQDADKISRHEKFGNFYRDPEQKIGNNRIWWSKDQAQHGGSVNKVFKETGRGLEHIADVDEFGNVMSKHKSPIGKEISWKELIGIK